MKDTDVVARATLVVDIFDAMVEAVAPLLLVAEAHGIDPARAAVAAAGEFLAVCVASEDQTGVGDALLFAILTNVMTRQRDKLAKRDPSEAVH